MHRRHRRQSTAFSNPHCEAWVGSFRRECLDKFVVLGEKHLDHITRSWESYYNTVRPHGALDNTPIALGDLPPPEFSEEKDGVVCQVVQAEHLRNLTSGDAWLGGLLRHYRRAA